jgi:hypothetical protein
MPDLMIAGSALPSLNLLSRKVRPGENKINKQLALQYA